MTTGRYSYRRLCELAEEADAGFDRKIMAELLAMLPRYPDRRFTAYGLDPEQITQMRQRFATWRTQLLAPDDAPQGAISSVHRDVQSSAEGSA